MPQDINDAHHFAAGRRPASVTHFALRRTVDPVDQAVSLEAIKCFLRLPADDDDNDVMLEQLIGAATNYVEVLLGRALITQTWEYKLDYFPFEFQLPRPPAISVTSIAYVDTDGASQTLATSVYQTDFSSEPGRISLDDGQTWPSTLTGELNAVTVTYTAGYGTDTTDVPANIQTAIMFLVQDYYDNPQGQLIGTIAKDNPVVMRLLGIDRQPRFF